MHTKFRYRAFISHGPDGKDFAEELGKSLVERGLRPFYDRNEERLGQANLASGLASALSKSKHMLIILSNQYPTSPWALKERNWWIHFTKSDPKRRTLIIGIAGHNLEVPPELSDVIHLDPVLGVTKDLLDLLESVLRK